MILVENPGELLGVDLMEYSKDLNVLVGIDYFTRRMFAKFISTREASKVVTFLNEVWKQLPFKGIRSDNGKEFDNKRVRDWLKDKKIVQTFAIPYYHQSNGRVERAIRTLREALRREKRPLRLILRK